MASPHRAISPPLSMEPGAAWHQEDPERRSEMHGLSDTSEGFPLQASSLSFHDLKAGAGLRGQWKKSLSLPGQISGSPRHFSVEVEPHADQNAPRLPKTFEAYLAVIEHSELLCIVWMMHKEGNCKPGILPITATMMFMVEGSWAPST